MKLFSRRTFLQTACLATAAPLVSCARPGREARRHSDPPRPCAASAWRKHGVVLEPTEPWEYDGIQNFTSPAEPLGGDVWRLWYSVSGSRHGGLAFAEGEPGGPMKKFRAECSPGEPSDSPFAIGGLPEGWRAVQGVHLRLRDGRHRLYFWAHSKGILRYLAAESRDGRRYRVLDPLRPVLYHPHDRAAHGVASPDGVLLHREPDARRPAAEPPAPPHLICNDAVTVYQLADGNFELYAATLVPVARDDPAYIAYDNAPGLIRVVDRFASEDGLRFEMRQRVVQRDAADPSDQQFYYLAVTHTRQGRVGLLGHYRCAAQTMDLEWCFSRDGVHWERPLRSAWLPRGEPPAPDCYGVYASHRLVRHRGRWHLFYTGVNSAHNGRQSCGPPRDVIMLATTDSIWAVQGAPD